jgi:hypothetical protein
MRGISCTSWNKSNKFPDFVCGSPTSTKALGQDAETK